MDNANDNTPINYALNGKIMLSSVIILFIVVCVVVCFHTYARCCSTRAHHRQRRRQRRPRQQLNNPSSANNYNATVNISSSQVSMDPRMLKTLPIFVYSSTAATAAALECTVCLSEFQNGERGRTLPKCGHAFHVACVDEWFLSHSNCPLCRAPVQPDNIVVVVDQPETSSAGVVITVIEDPASVSETRDSTGLYCSFPMADFQPEWCPRKAEGLVGLAAGSDLERNRCKPLSRGFGVCSTNTMR